MIFKRRINGSSMDQSVYTVFKGLANPSVETELSLIKLVVDLKPALQSWDFVSMWFGLLFRQNKSFKNVNLSSMTLWWDLGVKN